MMMKYLDHNSTLVVKDKDAMYARYVIRDTVYVIISDTFTDIDPAVKVRIEVDKILRSERR